MMSLRHTVVSGIGWTATGKTAAQVMQFIAGIALSRLLVPADFGLLAAVYVFAGFVTILADLGIGAAIVFLPDPTEDDLATAFWVNAILGVVCTLALGASARYIAALFHQPRLTGVSWVVALNFSLALYVVHLALLERAMRFRLVAVVELTAVGAGLVTSVAAAASGAGYWALAIGPVAQTSVMTALMWTVTGWRPRGFINGKSLRRLWGFAGGLLGFTTLNYWTRTADNLLVGRYAGASALGYYNRAYSVMMLPIGQIGQTLGRVMFPALARLRNETPRLADAYLRSLRLLCMLVLPIITMLAGIAHNLVVVAWGSAWQPTALLLELLCIAAIPQVLTSTVGWVFQSLGETRLFFRTGMVSATATVAAFAIGIHWGAVGVATAFLIRCWLLLHWTLDVPLQLVGLRGGIALRQNGPSLLVAAAMGFIVWSVGDVLSGRASSALALALQVGCALALYAARIRTSALDDLRDARGPGAPQSAETV